MVWDAPEVLLSDFPTGTVELKQLTRPEEVNAADDCAWADYEAVPHTAAHRLRIKARCAQQPGGQKGAKLGGEGHRPTSFWVRRPRQIEWLDAQRIPGQKEPALIWAPAAEGEHAA